MNVGKWVLAGSIGGLVSAALWAAITYSTGVEIGWIAWLVGVIVGFCVRMAAGEQDGVAPGVTAAGIAVLALLIGKFATVSLLVDKMVGEKLGAPQVTAENFHVELCGEVAREWTDAKKKMTWPPGMNVEIAGEAVDYPQEVRIEARARWDAKPAAEQEQLIAQRKTEITELSSMMRGEIKKMVFKASFNGMDILFFVLAVFSAFKVGSGLHSGD